jgi:hypothetical protein
MKTIYVINLDQYRITHKRLKAAVSELKSSGAVAFRYDMKVRKAYVQLYMEKLYMDLCKTWGKYTYNC